MKNKLFEIKDPEMCISLLHSYSKNSDKLDEYIDLINLLEDMDKQNKEYEKLFLSALKTKDRETVDRLLSTYLKVANKDSIFVDYLITNKKHVNKRKERKDLIEKKFGDCTDLFALADELELKMEEKGVSATKVLRRLKKIKVLMTKLETFLQNNVEIKESFKYASRKLNTFCNKYNTC